MRLVDRPVEYVDTTPIRCGGFRTDYVLMVAEAYAGEQDLDLARFRLAALGPLRRTGTPPLPPSTMPWRAPSAAMT
jgi:hypothetical protein